MNPCIRRLHDHQYSAAVATQAIQVQGQLVDDGSPHRELDLRHSGAALSQVGRNIVESECPSVWDSTKTVTGACDCHVDIPLTLNASFSIHLEVEVP